ncbi:RNA polymerase sigma factor [Anaerolentibacter hominis]|uniref:RNA polymerase sigma factor n=1 Tax=Anaerolentibacter hominis TaxID=3079009 RepID=UPI0031B80974
MADCLRPSDRDIMELYYRQVDTVYRVCFMMLKNTADAEDVTQNVFVKLIQLGKRFESEEHEKAWLIVAARNECKNLLGHWWRKKRTSIEDVNPQQLTAEHQYDETLEEVIGLPERFRLPVYLYYYEGYSTKEISGLLHRKEGTVRSQLHTGREMLKLRLGGGLDE